MAIANNNIYSLQLLRNRHVYVSKENAVNALRRATEEGGSLANVAKKDGVAVLARYKSVTGDTAEKYEIRTIVGYYADGNAISGDTAESGALGKGSHMTIIDVEGAKGDIEALRNEINAKLGNGVTSANTVTDQLEALSGSNADTSATTSVAGAKKYTDDKLNEEFSKLSATTDANENKVVTDVIQTNGKITTTATNLTSVKLDGYQEGTDADVAATDTLGQALGKLQAQINAMDKTADAVNGQVVTTVSEEDGKVTETKANVKDLQLGGYAKDTSASGSISSTDTINTALSKLENSVGSNKITNTDKSITVTEPTGTATTTDIKVNLKSGEKVIKLGTDGIYTNLNLVKISDSTLPTTVKERYELRDSDNVKIGEPIDIAKDSHIVSIRYITDSGDTHYQNLEYTYINVSGETEVEYVDMSSIVLEAEFASGVTATNHVVHGVVDPQSETNSGGTAFLTVGENGFKVDGIKQEIINRINELDATLENGTTDGAASTGHVKVSITETDGKLTTLTVSETNIADADDLAALSAKTVTEVASSNESITAALSAATDGTRHLDIITDASKIKMSGFTSTDVLSGITTSSSITEAFQEVDKVITDNEEVISAALNDLEEAKVDAINVNGKQSKETSSGDVVASVTINGADIKLDGYASGTSSAAIAANDTVNQAFGKLENQIKAAVDGGLQLVEAGNGVSVSTVQDNKQTISAKLADASNINGVEENAIKFNATDNGLYIEYLDCGTY